MRNIDSVVLAVTMAVVAALNSCSDSGSPTAPVFPDFQYPLQLGMSWTYAIRWAVYMTPLDGTTPVDSVITLLRSEVRSDRHEELMGRGQLVVLREDLSGADRTWWGETLVRNQTKGLYQYAYRGMSFRVLPKASRHSLIPASFTGAKPRFLPIGLLPVNIKPTITSSDSLYVEDEPVRVLAYPLRPGDNWIYREDDDFRIHRRVTGTDTVDTPAGQFICAVIEHLYDTDGDGQWEKNIQIVDYVAEIGLVKREVKMLSTWTGGSGEVLGATSSIETSVLVQPLLN